MREEDQERTCPYCGIDKVLKWSNTFEGKSLYKVHKCGGCGRKVTVKMPFMGSGDDSWGKDLDKRVEEDEAKSQKE